MVLRASFYIMRTPFFDQKLRQHQELLTESFQKFGNLSEDTKTNLINIVLRQVSHIYVSHLFRKECIMT